MPRPSREAGLARASKLFDEALTPFGVQSSQLPVLAAAALFGEDRLEYSDVARLPTRFTHSCRRGYWRNPSLSNRQIDDRGGSRQGHICVPHPLIVTESNKRETAEIGAKKTADLV